MKISNLSLRASLLAAAGVLSLYGLTSIGCNKNSTVTGPTDTTAKTDTTRTPTDGIPTVYKKIYGATSMTLDGDYLVIKSTGVPDHKSAYFQNTEWQSTMYEADTDPGFKQAPGNKIATVNLTFRIPLHPKEATTKSATSLGPMGIALNGVPLFNQYNGQNRPLTTELVSFDQWNGHPTPMNAYHYHVEPTWITKKFGKDALVGFLLDGFPVYGPMENGKTLTDADLDSYHGHFGPTADFPNGIYHYHTTADAPYINGDGFFGAPGTVTQ